MRQFIILAAVTALAVAKPELYKEKEDFQFSRSSTDEGSKSGFYGAQRGNMGGNYERAHNMDSLAQNQMSGLVRQVDGELGDGAKMRAGSVYTAANSRGTFGSRHFDLSNLAGRNFQEGVTHDNAQLNSGLSSSTFNNAAYSNSHSQSSKYSGYQAAEHTGLNLQSDNLQSLDNAQAQYDYGRHSSHRQDAAYAAGYGSADLHSGNYGSNVQTRLISATPVRIIVRPGTKVAIPVSAQTYDIAQGSLINQNSLNSEAEVLANNNQRTIYRPSNAKHYESSYNYRKEWEKHDTVPGTISLPTSTDNPFPRNSELYEDSRARASNDRYDASRLDSQRLHSSNMYGGYNAVKSTSHLSNSNYNTQQQRASSGANSNAYTVAGYNAGTQGVASHGVASETDLYGIHRNQYNGGATYRGAALDSSSLTQAAGLDTASASGADLNSQVESLNSKPKSYQSSYSYHKSWERQGDPYVIKPASGIFDGQSSQRLTSATKNQGYAMSGSHYGHLHQSNADCDENGHVRVARSYNANHYNEGQQQSENLEDFGQQAEDLGQQTVTDWDQQQSQNTWDKAENLGQQTQQTWDNFENLNQQSQNTFDKLENLDQQTQNNLGQQNQDSETEIGNKPLDFGQESQHEWDFSNAGQQEQDKLSEQTQDFQQPDIPETPLFTQELQKENDDQNTHHMHVWNTFGSHQSGSHNFPPQDEHVDFNGHDFNWHSISEREHAHHSWSNSQQTHSFVDHIEHGNTQGNPILSNGDLNIQSYNKHNEGQINENSGHEFHNSYGHHKWNTYTGTHDQSTNINSQSNVNTFQSNSSPLSNLWNKLNNIEQLSIPSSTNKDDLNIHTENNNFQTSLQNSNNNIQHEQINHTSTITEQQNQDSKKVISDINKSSETPLENVNSHNVERPQDIGRGDISSEDLTQDLGYDNKPYRNPITTTDDQTRKTENENNKIDLGKDNSSAELIVLGLNQHNSEEQKIRDTLSVMNTTITSTQNNVTLSQEQTLNKTEEKHVLNQNFASNDDESKYFQINGVHTPEYIKQQEYLEQQNLQNFGQHESLEQHNLQNYGQQENLEQNLQDFSIHENHEQQNLQDFDQLANQGQENLQGLGHHEHIEQQNLQDFGQQVNLEQQNTHVLGQEVNLEQQNLQGFSLHEHIEPPSSHGYGQQQNLEQQNLHEFGEQENLEQNSQEFSLHENPEEQILQDFGQHNLEQHNLEDFGQQNLEQQNLQNFGQQENLEQNLQEFSHHKKVEQENLQDFGQQNLEQQNLPDFGQQNLEQQNLQDFGQQNLHDFGEQNLDQQNLQDVGQQNLDHFGQQNLQDFGQQQNLHDFGQQNMQDFGQQSSQDFGQQLQTVHNFGHQSLDHTDLQQFDQHLSSEHLDKLSTNPKADSQPNPGLQHPAEIEEPVFVQKQNTDTHSISQDNPKPVTPIETETEKPGFWKSVGNKFSSAKSKISSWFGS